MRNERRWVWVFALVVMVLTTLPYYVAFSRQGADWRFTGFLFGVEDGNSYIAKMMIGTSGGWLFRTPYTAYPQNGIVLFPFYILLGKLVSAPGLHEQLVGLFHLMRFIGGILAILATYDFVSTFISSVYWRRWATVLAVLGGGLGWLVLFGLNGLWKEGIPLEYYSPEAFGFLSIFGLAHLTFARAFFLWGLRDYLLTQAGLANGRAWLRSSLLWLGVVLMQPMTGAVGGAIIALHLAVTGAWQMIQKRRGAQADWQTWQNYFFNALRVAVVTLPPVIYTLAAFKLDPYLKTWESQSLILSPAFGEYLLAYAVLLPLAIWGLRPLVKENFWRNVLVAAWVLAFPLLAYAPFSNQRRLMEGVWVAMTILAVQGLANIRPGLLRRLAYGWVGLAFPTTLFLWMGGLMVAFNLETPLFRPVAEVNGFNYLAKSAPADTVVLAAYETGNPLPAWAPVRTLYGLGTESANAKEIKVRVTCFYATCSEAERQALMDEFEVAYVFWGPAERALGAWDPGGAPYLKAVYHQGDYWVYQRQ